MKKKKHPHKPLKPQYKKYFNTEGSWFPHQHHYLKAELLNGHH